MASTLTNLAQQKTGAQLQSMSQQSFKWLGQKIAALRNPGNIPSAISREDFRKVSRFAIGSLYYFYYNPIGKDDLPYYDRFPLVLMLERYPDGFLGLNLHYLPLKYRVAFMDKLMDYATMTPDNEIKKMRVTYEILNASRRFKEFRPCIKRYLTSQIQSKILMVQPNEWDIAVFLPIHQFRKAKAEQVWEDSVEQIRNVAPSAQIRND
jgi:hypothetical protein